MNHPDNIPNRLIFSQKNAAKRKRSFVAVAALFTVQLCLIWPIYSFFSNPEPLILGFPQPFAWVILMVLCSFAALLILFLKDTKEHH